MPALANEPSDKRQRPRQATDDRTEAVPLGRLLPGRGLCLRGVDGELSVLG